MSRDIKTEHCFDITKIGISSISVGILFLLPSSSVDQPSSLISSQLGTCHNLPTRMEKCTACSPPPPLDVRKFAKSAASGETSRLPHILRFIACAQQTWTTWEFRLQSCQIPLHISCSVSPLADLTNFQYLRDATFWKPWMFDEIILLYEGNYQKQFARQV